MIIGYRASRILLSPSKRLLISQPRYISFKLPGSLNQDHQSTSKPSTTTAFGVEGNLGIAPKKKMAQIPTLTLNDGNKIPLLGYGVGTARATGGRGYNKDLVQTIVMAIKAGYHHLDGAQVYGNEAELGAAIAACGLPRSSLYITTKITGTAVVDTEATFSSQLQNLGVSYVDQYLIHAPHFAKSPADLQKKWADLEAIQASGRAKTIGVSNFLKSHLEAVLETAKVVPAINQIEYHPYLQHGELLAYMKEKGIAASAYAPQTAITKAKGGPVDGVYEELAKKYGVSEGEIALRWVIEQGIVALTTSGKEERLKSMLRVTEFELTAEEVERISEEGRKKHFRGFWKDKFAEDDRS